MPTYHPITYKHHHHDHQEQLGFSPILVGLVGMIAGAIMVAACHYVSLGCCGERGRQESPQSGSNQAHDPFNSTATTSTHVAPICRSYSNKDYLKAGHDNTCAICLSEFEEGDFVRVLPECNHLYHTTCIDIWISSHPNCPLCRAKTFVVDHQHVVSLPDSGGVPPLELHRLPDFGG